MAVLYGSEVTYKPYNSKYPWLNVFVIFVNYIRGNHENFHHKMDIIIRRFIYKHIHLRYTRHICSVCVAKQRFLSIIRWKKILYLSYSNKTFIYFYAGFIVIEAYVIIYMQAQAGISFNIFQSKYWKWYTTITADMLHWDIFNKLITSLNMCTFRNCNSSCIIWYESVTHVGFNRSCWYN